MPGFNKSFSDRWKEIRNEYMKELFESVNNSASTDEDLSLTEAFDKPMTKADEEALAKSLTNFVMSITSPITRIPMPTGLPPMPTRPCGCPYGVFCPHESPGKAEKIAITNEAFKPTDFLREVPEVEQTLAVRGSRYGDFSDNARISQQLKRILEGERSWAMMPHEHREGLTMILQKIARIVNGDHNYADNWHDIQGYAKLVEDRLPKSPL